MIRYILFYWFGLLFATLLGAPAKHPQEKIFGPRQFTYVDTFPVPDAGLVMINPNLSGEDFALFVVPHLEEFVDAFGKDTHPMAKKFGLATFGDSALPAERQFVPAETGRGVLLPPSSHPLYRDIMIKGTGPVDLFTADNKLRLSHLGFDGHFEVSEAVRDMIASEILSQAGVLVARGIAIVDYKKYQPRGDRSYRMGSYARAFIVQTRLSNLIELQPRYRKAAIDDAIAQIARANDLVRPFNYVEYFYYMASTLAKAAAIYQVLGYTQDSLHYGQVTLAGELCDLEIGSWKKPKKKGENNTKYPWFRYERQPLLLQNMLIRSHSVKAEPEPARLSADSGTFQKQQSLFGMIDSFAPEAASKIKNLNPELIFWDLFDYYFSRYDNHLLRKRLFSKIDLFYNWEFPSKRKKEFDSEQWNTLAKEYKARVNLLEKGLINPARSGAQGLLSFQKQALYVQIIREKFPHLADRFAISPYAPWRAIRPHDTLFIIPDLSWRPPEADLFNRLLKNRNLCFGLKQTFDALNR